MSTLELTVRDGLVAPWTEWERRCTQGRRLLEAGTYAKKVRDDFRSGVRSGVNGTPTFFVNGTRYDGSWANGEAFIRALHDAARQAVEASA